MDSYVDYGEVTGTVGYGLGGDAAVEGGEIGTMAAGQGEEIASQSTSSASFLTNSGVTGPASGRTGKRRMPLRVTAG